MVFNWLYESLWNVSELIFRIFLLRIHFREYIIYGSFNVHCWIIIYSIKLITNSCYSKFEALWLGDGFASLDSGSFVTPATWRRTAVAPQQPAMVYPVKEGGGLRAEHVMCNQEFLYNEFNNKKIDYYLYLLWKKNTSNLIYQCHTTNYFIQLYVIVSH